MMICVCHPMFLTARGPRACCTTTIVVFGVAQLAQQQGACQDVGWQGEGLQGGSCWCCGGHSREVDGGQGHQGPAAPVQGL
eukprot:3406881-Alexandrium_andersonii.AAC.1